MKLKFAVLAIVLFLLIPVFGFAQKSKGQTSKKAEAVSNNKNPKKKATPKPNEQTTQNKEQTDKPADSTQENAAQPSPSSQPSQPSNIASSNIETSATPVVTPKKKVFGNSDIETPSTKSDQPQNDNANSDEFTPKTFDPNGYTRRDGTYVTPRIGGGRGRVPVKKQ